MSRTQHTPGPWAVSKDHPLQVKAVDGPSHNTVALLGDYYDRPTREANARLIAAAPDLLEALEYLQYQIAVFPNFAVSPRIKEMLDAVGERAATAIAKAHGGQP